MSRKIVLCIVLIVGLAAIGAGAWLAAGYGSETDPDNNTVTTVSFPEGTPFIYERVSLTMAGENNQLYIYPDGSVVLIEEKGLRLKTPENPPTRTWKKGELTDEQMNDLLAYFENSGIEELEDSYTYPGTQVEGGGIGTSDMRYEIIIDTDNLNKKVEAYGYLSPDNGETYPDMPYPLNEIYEKLRSIAQGTEEVYQEDIQG